MFKKYIIFKCWECITADNLLCQLIPCSDGAIVEGVIESIVGMCTPRTKAKVMRSGGIVVADGGQWKAWGRQ